MGKNLSKIELVHSENVFHISPWFGGKYRMVETISIFNPVAEIKFENEDGSDIKDEKIVSALEQVVDSFEELPTTIGGVSEGIDTD